MDRSLSPITERTTPGSFRTVSLPLVDHLDYTSEREGPPSPVASAWSRGSGNTITRDIVSPQEVEPTPGRLSPSQCVHLGSMNHETSDRPLPDLTSSFPPLHPANRGLSSDHPSQSTRQISKSNSSSQNPSNEDIRKRYMERFFPKAEGEVPKDNQPHDGSEEGHGSGLAGIGAGKNSRPGSIRSRPNSFHAGRPNFQFDQGDLAFIDPTLQRADLPRLISSDASGGPALHNIPYVSGEQAEEWSFSPSGSASPYKLSSKSPDSSLPGSSPGSRPTSRPTSRSNSLRQRPHSFHDSRLSATSDTGDTIKNVPPTLNTESFNEPANLRKPSPPSTRRPHLKPTQSDSPLPRSHPSSRSPTRIQQKKTPPRRRIVSSIFGSLFGSDDAGSNGTVSNSHRKSQPVSSASKHDQSDLSIQRSVILASKPSTPAMTETAIRTSGTFGIRDDGSELYQEINPRGSRNSPRPLLRHRSRSGTGSVQSLGLQRVLVVQNGDTIAESAMEDDEPTPRFPILIARSSPLAEETEESGGSKDAFYTPLDISAPISLTSRPGIGAEQSDSSATNRPRFEHRRSFSPPSARSAIFVPLESPIIDRQRPLTPPPALIAATIPSLGPPVGINSISYIRPNNSWKSFSNRPRGSFVPIGETDGTSDAAVQTSPQMPALPPIRPLPRPPSERSRPSSLVIPSDNLDPMPTERHRQGAEDREVEDKPTLNIPPPPDSSPSPRASSTKDARRAEDRSTGSTYRSSPASDLPLLIASHLLSSHAAALMRHSTSMRDVSEVMAQMAKESLDWGGMLLSMSQNGNPAFHPGPVGGISPPTIVPPSQAFHQSYTGGIDGLPLRSYPTPQSTDPLREAFQKLNGMTTDKDRSPSRPHPFAALPDQETDNFTPIPPRPTTSRKSSRPKFRVEDEQQTTARSRHASLPAEWLGEADRLGREGWDNLRRAEEAWKGALESFKLLAQQQGTTPHVQQETLSRRDFPIPSQGSRSRHGSLDLSYPRKMDRAEMYTAGLGISTNAPGTSFVPKTEDMLDVLRSTGNLTKASQILGPHAGVDQLYRPNRPPSPGYTNANLGFEDIETIKARPISRMTHETVNTASSGRQGKKLSKKMKQRDPRSIPSSFRAGHDHLHTLKGGEGEDGQVDQEVGSARKESKKHWWSRRRAGSLAA